jgi:ribonuclease BN (tRNA processing enzyme)
MRIVILGTGTGIPVKARGSAGLYVHVGGEHLLFDSGPGTLKRLTEVGVTYQHLDRIFYTHYHPDHCLDLVSILFAMRIPAPARKRPLAIYGPRGLKTLYRQLNRAFHGWIEPQTYRLTLKEIDHTRLAFSDYRVRTARMNHSAAALGYRVETGGKSVVYSGDTDRCEEIIVLGRGADALILECSHPDERKVIGHLTPTECGRIAAEAGCRHLVLTHFYPVFQGYDIRKRVRQSFRGRLTLARDLQAFVL